MGGAAAALLPISDTLQVGTNAPSTLVESPLIAESVSQTSSFTQPGQNITGTQIIGLTDPGTDNISDIVTATISLPLPAFAAVAPTYELKVTLVSDGENPLPSPPGLFETLDETGAAQNLSADFASAFDFGGNPLPAILVTSDADGVPEPSTWAMMLIGFAGLGVFGGGLGRRKAAAA